MDLAVGAIVEGKVTGITKFGAFVALPEGKSGMVHISEVASTFVNDIKDFLQEGQQVKVKIINIDQAGRINLSIKKAQPQEPRQPRPERREGGFAPRQPRFQRSSAPRGAVHFLEIAGGRQFPPVHIDGAEASPCDARGNPPPTK